MSATPDSLIARVRDRAMRLCERCGRPGSDVHHRQPRKQGGATGPLTHTTVNCVFLCRDCHTECELERDRAYTDGWLIHSWDDPRDVPFEHYVYLTLVWPDFAGGFFLYPPSRAELSATFPGHDR